MKKITALLIVLCSLFSLSSCLSLRATVELVGDEIKQDESWGSYVVVRPDENGEWHYQIKWKISPESESDRKVTFTVADKSTDATVDGDGRVTLSSAGMITVTLSVKNSSSTATLTVIARN